MWNTNCSLWGLQLFVVLAALSPDERLPVWNGAVSAAASKGKEQSLSEQSRELPGCPPPAPPGFVERLLKGLPFEGRRKAPLGGDCGWPSGHHLTPSPPSPNASRGAEGAARPGALRRAGGSLAVLPHMVCPEGLTGSWHLPWPQGPAALWRLGEGCKDR